ncbi:MAG TPA: DinB family protein, partial [Pirellulaceae bacterium]
MGSMFDDLFAHYDWSRTKLLTLSQDLGDGDLDAEAPLGFGTLRATYSHLWAAERLWLDRWQGKPWQPLDESTRRISIPEFAAQFEALAAERRAFLDSERSSGYVRIVEYQNTRREAFRNRLADLMLHVTNHGIHHRAQALQFLRRRNRTIPGGIDYLFYRLAYPVVPLDQEAIGTMRGYGLEVDTAPGNATPFDPDLLLSYCRYGDWATERLLTAAANLDGRLWDQAFGMGMGTLRKTLLHCLDAERWWYRNWTEGPSSIDKLPEETPYDQIHGMWHECSERRNAYLAQLTSSDWGRVVGARPGDNVVHFRLG